MSGMHIWQRGDTVSHDDLNFNFSLSAGSGIAANRLHNGGFGINQRVQVSGVALADGAYGHDRWKAGAGGCTYTFSQTQPTTVITITAGTLQQVIEALTVEGGTYTLSWIGTATARINAGAYLASPITVTGLAVNTAITVEFNIGTVGRAQLEAGSVSSPFARRSFRYELAECQRFYQTDRTQLSVVATAVGQALGYRVAFPVAMRAAPTVALQALSETNCSGTAPAQVLTGSFFTTTASLAAGVAGFVASYTASADL